MVVLDKQFLRGKVRYSVVSATDSMHGLVLALQIRQNLKGYHTSWHAKHLRWFYMEAV